nr:MAG TPA: hypothetical protein [Caudoviricetes sp.]
MMAFRGCASMVVLSGRLILQTWRTPARRGKRKFLLKLNTQRLAQSVSRFFMPL